MGSLLALVSSLLWGTADYLAGNLSKRYKAIAVTAISQLFGLAFGLLAIFLFADFMKPNLSMSGYFIPGVIAGVAGFVGLVAFYTGLATGRMGVVSPISSLSVLIPLLLALARGERPSALESVGISIAIAGAFMASGPEVRDGLPIKPLLLAVVASIGFGLALTFIAIGSETDSLHTMTSMRVASVSICVLLAFRYRSLGGIPIRQIPLLILIGVADFLANFFLGVATTKGLVSIAMALGSLFPIVTILLAYKFLHERLAKVQYLGIAFALSGVLLIAAS
ncbi:MAG: DMT family transporter [Actinobacteria bacterium]|nr:DMT family transporter [Actinomycetota bacterium]